MTFSMPNPFMTGRPVRPKFFIGRDEIIRRCKNKLEGPVLGSIAINGEVGLGKTSLLHYLRHRARRERWNKSNLYIYYRCSDLEQFSPSRFYYQIIDRLWQEEDDTDIQKRVEQSLDKDEIDFREFRQFLRWLNNRNRVLVLLLDGFTWVVKNDTADITTIGDFLSHLRSLTNDPDFDLVLLTATREPLHILCGDIVRQRPESEFYNGFDFQTLMPFTDAEIGLLINQATQQTNFVFDQMDLNFLAEMAGSHPALLQTAGYLLFDARQQGPLDDGIREKVTNDFEREARRYFESLWQDSSMLEQTLMVLLILAGLTDRDSVKLDLSAAEINEILHTYERDLINLADRGLVRKPKKIYEIFSIVFARWLIREVTAGNRGAKPDQYKALTKDIQQVWKTFEHLAPDLTLNPHNQMLVSRASLTDPSLGIPKRYDILEEIGRGANGVVYKAFDQRMRRTVALKRLKNHKEKVTLEDEKRLSREARAAAKLNHPNIITVYDTGQTREPLYIVMEFLEGQSLAEILAEKKHLPLDQVITWMEQAASALDFAHTEGVIHRDIKPANLMITKDGVLKLADFGIAKVAGDPFTTHGNELKGTVQYMSPEQINEKSADKRSDLFSLAVVAFEMLSGRSPWSGKTYFELMKEIADPTPHSLAEYNVPAAKTLDDVFQKSLTRDPNQRYQTGQEFVEALKGGLIELSGNRWPDLVGINADQNKWKALTHLDWDVLVAFCYDHLEPFYTRLASGESDHQRIDHLVTYYKKNGSLDDLLAEVQAYVLGADN